MKFSSVTVAAVACCLAAGSQAKSGSSNSAVSFKGQSWSPESSSMNGARHHGGGGRPSGGGGRRPYPCKGYGCDPETWAPSQHHHHHGCTYCDSCDLFDSYSCSRPWYWCDTCECSSCMTQCSWTSINGIPTCTGQVYFGAPIYGSDGLTYVTLANGTQVRAVTGTNGTDSNVAGAMAAGTGATLTAAPLSASSTSTTATPAAPAAAAAAAVATTAGPAPVADAESSTTTTTTTMPEVTTTAAMAMAMASTESPITVEEQYTTSTSTELPLIEGTNATEESNATVAVAM